VNYRSSISKHCRLQHFTVTPKDGILNAHEEVKLEIMMVLGLPRSFREYFFIRIGSFEETRIDVAIDGTFEQVCFSLPRTLEDPTRCYLAEQDVQEPEKLTVDSLLKGERALLLQQMTTRKGQRCVANYVLDFGDIIICEVAPRTFTVHSLSHFPLSFEMDLGEVRRSGFKVEPAIVKGMTPNSDVVIEVSFNPINRRCDDIGLVHYSIPVLFSDGHHILLTLSATLVLPELNFSLNKCDFECVIIGQTKVMPIQLQNMNPVSCEFRIAEPSNVVCFTVTPTGGVLPPTSFMNISFAFKPQTQGEQRCTFGINIMYNPHPSNITVSGTGVQLSLNFVPQVLRLPACQPFAEASRADVTVENPSAYPIEFFSLQFDQQLYIDENTDPRQSECAFVTYTPKARTQAASKFAVCFIVNGPPLSGKSTIAKALSAAFDVPILDLKSLWTDPEE
jgi:hydrocephalus-inducing protein